MSAGDVVLENNGSNNEDITQNHQQVLSDHPHRLTGKKLSWPKLRRNDSLDVESRSVSNPHAHGAKV